MRKTILLLILIISFSCVRKSTPAIDLYNGISFGLQKGESPAEIRSDVDKLYAAFFNYQQPQVPLFRYVKHPNYKLFIGIPYDTSIQQLIKAQSAKARKAQGKFESGAGYFYSQCQKDGFYIAEFAKEWKKNTIIYISAMTSQKEIADSLFSKVNLSKRLTLKDS